MNRKTPQTGLDTSFDDDDLDWDAWLYDDLDSFESESKRAPVAPVGAILKQARRKIGEKGISQEEMERPPLSDTTASRLAVRPCPAARRMTGRTGNMITRHP